MNILEVFILVVYSILLIFIFLYSLSQLDILRKYVRRKRTISKPQFDVNYQPLVTIQLPVFNEKYVVERLIDAVGKVDYPKEKLEVQVLDDSTDETRGIIQQKVEEMQNRGIDIKHLHRNNRKGFKAGALAEGLKVAKGEFVAVFDADFLPPPNFLTATIGYFQEDRLGVVQTPWQHLNHDYSLLTKLQAFGLNAHFSIEQGGRNAGGHFINFNGTGGIWRKTCIEDAGGWSSDTLTEDLDLSYRAQLKGWQFLFTDSVGAPAELPANMKALRTQQYRWTKGAAECARKNLGKVLASTVPTSTKMHAFFHLMNSFIFICVVLTAILSVPVLFLKNQHESWRWFFNTGSVFLISFGILGFYYWFSARENAHSIPYHKKKFVWYFPLFLSMTMGLSLHNAIGVVEGYLGKKTPFLRTPKFNIVKHQDTWKGKGYLSAKFSALSLIEGVLAVFFAMACVWGVQLEDYGLFPLHFLLFIGFGTIFLYSVFHSKVH